MVIPGFRNSFTDTMCTYSVNVIFGIAFLFHVIKRNAFSRVLALSNKTEKQVGNIMI